MNIINEIDKNIHIRNHVHIETEHLIEQSPQ